MIIPIYKNDFQVANTIIDEIDSWVDNHIWKLDCNGYIYRCYWDGVKSHRLYLHREIARAAGLDTSQNITHLNHDRLDNHRSNLRSISPAQRCQSRTSKGTFKRRQKWASQLIINGERHYFGLFDNPFEAQAMRELKRIGL